MFDAEIPQEQWEGFLHQFSLDHEGWIIDLEWPGDEPKSARETEYTLDTIETSFEDGESRVVFFLTGRDPLVIENPERISVLEEEGFEDEFIEIQTPTAALCLHLRFPESLAHLGMREGEEPDADASGLPSRDVPGAEEELTIEDEFRVPF